MTRRPHRPRGQGDRRRDRGRSARLRNLAGASVLILLLLALTLAAAIRPGVEALERRGVPHVVAIRLFFVLGRGGSRCSSGSPSRPPWTRRGRRSRSPAGWPPASAYGARLAATRTAPSPVGTAVIHPIATYGKAGDADRRAVFFALAATWYRISDGHGCSTPSSRARPERTASGPADVPRDRAAARRLRAAEFLMILLVAVVLSISFYLVGLHYWLLVGAS